MSVTGDTLDESDETVVVRLRDDPTNATIATATGTGTITDDDDEEGPAPALPSLSISSASVGEGDSGTANLTFTVTLSAASSQQVTVDYADAGTGTATSGTDYTALTAGTLTFAAGDTSKTITVSVTGDTLDESDETVKVTLSEAANATISTATGTGTITDDDDAPTLSISSPSVGEGDSGTANLTFTVSLSTASGKQVTVNYADAGTGTATSGTDYTALTAGTLTFAAGDTSKTITVSVTGDTLDEGDETVEVKLSGAANATIATATGTGTITDDDGATNPPSALPSLSISSPSVSEGDSGSTNLTFTVTLSASSSQQVTVDYADAGTGTATSGTDYTALTAGSLTFAAGDTSQTIAVSVTGDTLDEGDETVEVKLSGAANATIATATGTGTITDDDDAPSLSISSPSVGEGDSGTANLTFTVTLSAASGKQVTANYVDAGTGTATAGTDYTALTAGSLTFAAGETSKTITVSVTGDTLDEGDETVEVKLSGAANATIATATGTGTITDDDGATNTRSLLPSLSISSASVGEGDSGSTNLTFTVTLSASSSQQVTVDYADAGTGTATSGTDYEALTAGALTFAAGETSKTITVSVTGDARDEPDETVKVTLSGAANATIATATGTGTITDDDDAPSLSISSPSVSEGNSGTANLTFTVTLSAASGKQVTANYVDAGTGTATAGTDYEALAAGSLTFAAGDTSKTITVSVRGDTLDEGDETVEVKLSGAANATIATATGTGTITDDDGATDPPSALPSLSISSPSVSEGDSGTANLTFTVTLSASSSQQVTVDYADAGTGTATSGTDYEALTAGALTFAAGETSKTITVSVTGDARDEPDETVKVKLSGAANATIATATGTGSITDDDDTPSLSISSPSVSEGNSGTANLTFTVTLSAPSNRRVTVEYTDSGTGTATSGTDYTALAAATLTFSAGDISKTITVSVTGDTLNEPNETVKVTLRAAVNAAIATATGTGSIIDDDSPPDPSLTLPSLSFDSPSVVEGDSGTANLTFTVALSAASEQQVTVEYADAGTGTATSGTDYTELPAGALTFAPGETSKTITVSVIGDTLDEPDETVEVTLSGAVNATIAAATGAGAITDDDDTPALSISSPSVREGNIGTANLTFTVTLSAASNRRVTVEYADSRTGTATSGTDYTELPAATLTFSAGDISKTVTVAVTGDTLNEPNETVKVTLRAAVNAAIATATGIGAIIDDDSPPATDDKRRLSISSPSVDEGNGGSTPMTFTVTLSSSSSQQVTVDYTDSRTGTATSGRDYTELPAGTLTFAAGETSKTITVAVLGDTVDEPDETVQVTLSGADNATIARVTGTGTITDEVTDDEEEAPPALPSLSISSPSAREGNGGTANLTFTVTLSAASGQQVTVEYADAGTGTATSGTDYEALAAGTLTFAPGETSKTIVVSVRGDTLDEPDETVEVTLSSAVNATIAAATGTGVIIDDTDDLAPSFGDASVAPQRYTKGQEIDAFALPEATGGNGTLTYTLAPILPSGLAFDAETRIVSGAPTVIAAERLFTLTATDEDGDADTLTFTVEVKEGVDRTRERSLDVVLAAFGRTSASEAVEVIGERFEGERSTAQHVNLGGQALPLGAGSTEEVLEGAAGFASMAGYRIPREGDRRFGLLGGLYGDERFGGSGIGTPYRPTMGARTPHGPSALDLLARSSFALSLGGAGEDGAPRGLRVWGRGGLAHFSGRPVADLSIDGKAHSGYAGVDYRLGANVLLGVAAARTTGDVQYESGGFDGASGEGAVNLAMTSVLPYLHWAPRQGLGVWGLLGAGWGRATLRDEEGTARTKIGMSMAAFGGRKKLTSWESGELAVKADAFQVAMRSEARVGLRESMGDARRARLMLEGRGEWATATGMRLQPFAEFGGRWDGGAADTGAGAEVGGGLELLHTRGVSLEARGRYLLAHQSAEFEEWGASVTLRFGSGVDKRGLWFALTPEWGAPSSGVQTMWRQHQQGMPGGPGARSNRLGLEVGRGQGKSIGLMAERQERKNGASAYGLMFRGQLSW